MNWPMCSALIDDENVSPSRSTCSASCVARDLVRRCASTATCRRRRSPGTPSAGPPPTPGRAALGRSRSRRIASACPWLARRSCAPRRCPPLVRRPDTVVRPDRGQACRLRSRGWSGATARARSPRPRTSSRAAPARPRRRRARARADGPPLGRDRGVPAGVVGRDAQGRPVRHHDRRAVRRRWAWATSRPRSCSRSSPGPTCRARSSPSSSSTARRARSSTSAPTRMKDRWLPIAATRRGAVLHRDQRDRGRLGGQPHAGPAHPRRRRLPPQRLQELRDRRAQGALRASCGAASPGSEGTKGIGAVVVDLERRRRDGRRHAREDGAARHERSRARVRRRAHRARGRAARAATRRTASRSRR